MADEKIQIDLLIETAKSAKNLNDIRKSLQLLKEASASVTKESKDYDKLTKAIADSALQGAEAASSYRDMRKAVKDLKDAMEQVGTQDKQFTKLNAAAGQLEHKMKMVSDAIKYTSGTPIHNLSAGFKGLRDSVLSLNFEEAEIAMKSIGNSMMGLAKGAMKNLGDRFKSFGTGTTKIFKSLGKAVGGDLKGGLKMVGDGFKDLGNALKVNPLFIIASIIIFIISKFDELKTSGGLIGKVFHAIGDAISTVIGWFKKLGDWLGLTNNAAQDAAQALYDLHKQEAEQAEKSYDRLQKVAEAEVELAKAKAKNKADELKIAKETNGKLFLLELQKLEFAKTSAQTQIDDIERIREANGDLTDDQKKELEELKNKLKDTDAEIQAATLKYQAEQLKADKDIADNKKETEKKSAEDYKKAKEKQFEELKKQTQIDIQNTKEHTADRVNAEEKAMDEILLYSKKNAKALGLNAKDLTLMAQENIEKKKQLEADFIQYQDELDAKDEEKRDKKIKEEADDLKKKEADRKKDFEDEIQLEELKIKINADHQDKKVLAAELARVELKAEGEKELDDLNQLLSDKKISIDDYNNQILQVNANTSKANIQIDKQEQEAKAQEFSEYVGKVQSMQDSMFSAISDLTEAFHGKSKAAAKRAFETQKQLSVVNATVSGIEAVIKALAAPPGFPFTIPFAAAAAAMTAANIAKIEGTQFSDSGGGGAGSSASLSTGGGSGGSYGSNVHFGGQTFGGQGLYGIGNNNREFQGLAGQNISGGGGSQTNQPQVIKAYVVSQEIEKSLNKNAVINRRANI